MAVQNATINRSNGGDGSGSIVVVTWNTLANGDTGFWIPFPEWADRTVHIYGTFGAGGSISMQGSNEPAPAASDANAVVLTDQNGVAMTYTALALKQMTEAPLWIRPVVTAGDGTTALTVVLCARRMQPMITGG